MSHLNQNEEMELDLSMQERNRSRASAELYAIFQATARLERAFISTNVTRTAYEQACIALIRQCDLQREELGLTTRESMLEFKKRCGFDLPLAFKRLIDERVPAQEVVVPQERNEAVLLANTVELIVTAMDAVSMLHNAVDSLSGPLMDLMESLNKHTSLPPDWEPKMKLRTWVARLRSMRAAEALTEEDKRQLLYELTQLRDAFRTHLAAGGGGGTSRSSFGGPGSAPASTPSSAGFGGFGATGPR